MHGPLVDPSGCWNFPKSNGVTLGAVGGTAGGGEVSMELTLHIELNRELEGCKEGGHTFIHI